MTEEMSEDSYNILKAFCVGINLWIDETKNNLPLEFKILGIKPHHWIPSDVVGYARMMAHELQSSWKAEIVYGAVKQYFGEEKLRELYPEYRNSQPTISQNIKEPEMSLVYDQILEEEFFNSGIYNYLWEGENLSSGIYFITLQAEVNNIQPVVFSRKMIYLK